MGKHYDLTLLRNGDCERGHYTVRILSVYVPLCVFMRRKIEDMGFSAAMGEGKGAFLYIGTYSNYMTTFACHCEPRSLSPCPGGCNNCCLLLRNGRVEDCCPETRCTPFIQTRRM